jgi:acylphosphatase
MKCRRVRVWVSGRVQGVFYRATACERGQALGLTGWARNLADGRVEIVAEGVGENIEALLTWCAQGPIGARVDAVEVVEESPTGEFQNFEVRRDR